VATTCNAGDMWNGTHCIDITQRWLEKKYSEKFCDG
jgi:hypothetical protein